MTLPTSFDLGSSEFRRLFPVFDTFTYLDHASIAPLSSTAATAVNEQLLLAQNEPHRLYGDIYRRAASARTHLAHRWAVDAENVAITPGISHALTMLADALASAERPQVLALQTEFPGVITPFARHHRWQLTMTDTVDSLLTHLTKQTGCVLLSDIQALTPTDATVEQVAERCGELAVPFIVDATQGAAFWTQGQPPGVTAVVASAHKALLGSPGLGFAYVDPRADRLLTRLPLGWRSLLDPFDPASAAPASARRFEVGTLSSGPLAVSEAALATLFSFSGGDLQRHVGTLVDAATDALGLRDLSVATSDSFSPLLFLRPRGRSVQELHEHLTQQQIITSLRGNSVRIAFHAYSNNDDVARLGEAVQTFVQMEH